MYNIMLAHFDESEELFLKNSTKDMTVGSPLKAIISFIIPMLGGILFQQFYNMVDTMVIGQWIGNEALAGVGSTGSINFMIVGFCTGLGMGFTIPLSHAFGAKDFGTLRKFLANTIYVSVALVSVITVLVSVFCRDILVIMDTTPECMEYAYNYIFIIFLGLPVLYAYNLLASIIRAMGDSKTPVIFLMISAALNIVLDIISVGIMNMGVAGPALATVISQLVSVILCLIYMIKKFDILRFEREDLKLDFKKIGTSLSMGLAMGLQTSITAIGSVLLQRSVNNLGTSFVAAMTAGQKVGSFAVCPYEAIGGTMASYVGQNTGIGNAKRIKQGVSWALIIGAVYGIIAFLVLFFFGDKLSLLYLEKTTNMDIVKNAHLYLIVHSASYLLVAGVNTLRFAIQGMGYSSLAIFAGILEMVARGALGLFIIPKFGYIAACFSGTLAWLLADLFLIPAFLILVKRIRPQSAVMSQSAVDNAEV